MSYRNVQFLLIVIYVLLVAVVTFRIAVHPTQYTTPDSIAYLEQSQKIKTNFSTRGFFGGFASIKSDFSTWPVGYPACIALVSGITNTTPLIASKIVNFIFLGLLFFLLFRWFGNNSWLLALSLYSYGSLEVISETWSELPFVFFVFLLCYLVIKEDQLTTVQLSITLMACLICLFLLRYVGVIYFLDGRKNTSYAYGIAIFFSTVFAGCYIYHNKIMTGYLTGIARVEVGHQSFIEFIKYLLISIFNELSIARNYSPDTDNIDLLFILLLAIQLGVVLVIYKQRHLLTTPLLDSKHTKTLLLFAASYLAGMVMLKVMIPIDGFDFRILFPFTALLFISALNVLIEKMPLNLFKNISKLLAIFMILSLLINLPKRFLFNRAKSLFSTTERCSKYGYDVLETTSSSFESKVLFRFSHNKSLDKDSLQ